MTSISSLASSQRPSPLDRLQAELASEVSAGTVSSFDSDALSSAIKDIDSSLKSDGAASAVAGGTRPSPNDIKSKIDELIASQVSDGKQTSDQASELKNVFAQTFAKGPDGAHGRGHGGGGHGGGGPGGPGGGGGPGGPGGPGGAGGPPPGGPPPSGGKDSSNDSDSSTSSSTDSSSSSTSSDVIQLLKDFVKAVQNQVSKSSASYDANGQNTKVTASLVVDYQS